MSTSRDSRYPDEWDLDEAELGERVAWCLTEDMQVYGRLEDRAWHVVLVMYGRMARALGADQVPPEWRPALDSSGRWRMP